MGSGSGSGLAGGFARSGRLAGAFGALGRFAVPPLLFDAVAAMANPTGRGHIYGYSVLKTP